jgi:hypothetical protein
MEGLGTVLHTVFGILCDLVDRPIPHASQVGQPRVELVGLRGVEPKLELPLDHPTPVELADIIPAIIAEPIEELFGPIPRVEEDTLGLTAQAPGASSGQMVGVADDPA